MVASKRTASAVVIGFIVPLPGCEGIQASTAARCNERRRRRVACGLEASVIDRPTCVRKKQSDDDFAFTG